MPAFPRREMEEMVRRWLEANQRAESQGNWRPMADLYAPDAHYCWDIPGGLYEARGREVIRQTCLGDAMDPYLGWTYPYEKVVIDEHSGEVMGIWWQIPPTRPKRADGSEIKVIGASWFEYAGNYLWAKQRDLYDFGKTMAMLDEVAELGLLSELAMERKRQRDAAKRR
jgi:hypothetical protein